MRTILVFCSPIFVVSRLDPVERLPEGCVGDVLVVHLLDLEAVGEVLELDVGVFLDRQLRVGDRLREVGTQVVEDLMKRKKNEIIKVKFTLVGTFRT